MPDLNQILQQIIAFYKTNHKLVSFMQRLICARFPIGFENGLPSIYALKRQPSNSIPPPTKAEACERGEKPYLSLLLHNFVEQLRDNQRPPKVLCFELNEVIQYTYIVHAKSNCY